MNLSVNGSNQVVDAPGDTKLLWVIREHLRLTGQIWLWFRIMWRMCCSHEW